MDDFHRRRNMLYAEFPQAAALYESEFRELQARLAEAERLIREIREDGVYHVRYQERMDAFLADQPSADPIIHAQHGETGRVWCGPRSNLPPGYGEVCTDAEYTAQVAADKGADQPSAADSIPLCAGHADWWFTSRNHLSTDRCVVCAFETTDKGKEVLDIPRFLRKNDD